MGRRKAAASAVALPDGASAMSPTLSPPLPFGEVITAPITPQQPQSSQQQATSLFSSSASSSAVQSQAAPTMFSHASYGQSAFLPLSSITAPVASSGLSNSLTCNIWDAATTRAMLKNTRLSHMRDRDICQWLRDIADWLGDQSTSVEVRFQVLSVMETLPWWRYVTATTSRGAEAPPQAANSKSLTESKTYLRLLAAFERLCVVLLNLSQHLLRGVIAVALRPFSTPPFSGAGALQQDNFQMLLPVETVSRIINHAAVRYPHLAGDVLLEQSIDPLFPKRRFPFVHHHLSFLRMMLALALNATLAPPEHTMDVGGSASYHVGATSGEEDIYVGLDGDEEGASSRKRMRGETTESEYESTPAVQASTKPGKPTALSALLGPRRSEMAGSDDTLSSSTTTASTTSVVLLHSSAALAAASVVSPHNNRMMAHRNKIIALLLKHLLEMEVNIMTEHEGSGHRSSTNDTNARSPQDKHSLAILKKLVQFVYEKLADDMRTQQSAGQCGNSSWWRELLNFHVNSVLLMKRPLVLHGLAPRLALLGSDGEMMDLMHKVVSTTLKGMQQSTAMTVGFMPSSSGGKLVLGGGGGKASGSAHLRGGLHMQHSSMMPPQYLPTESRVRAAMHIAPLAVLFTSHTASAASTSALHSPTENTRVHSPRLGSAASHNKNGASPRLPPAATSSGGHHHHHYASSLVGCEDDIKGVWRRLLKWIAVEVRQTQYQSILAVSGGEVVVASSAPTLVDAVFWQCQLMARHFGLNVGEHNDVAADVLPRLIERCDLFEKHCSFGMASDDVGLYTSLPWE